MPEQPDAERTTQGVVKVFGRVKQAVVTAPPAPVAAASDTSSGETDGKRRVVFGRSGLQADTVGSGRASPGTGTGERAAPIGEENADQRVGQATAEAGTEAEAEVSVGAAQVIYEDAALQQPGFFEGSTADPAVHALGSGSERGRFERVSSVDDVLAHQEQRSSIIEVAEAAEVAEVEPQSAARESAPIAQTVEHPFAIEVKRLAQQVALMPPIPDIEDIPDENPLEQTLSDELLHLLEDKMEEFHWLGYSQVTAQDLWTYFRGQIKRRPKSLHELVNAVLCLQPQEFMNYSLTQAYRRMPTDIRDLL